MKLFPIRQRILWLLGAAILLQLLFAALPVPLYARSERFHATVLALWLLDFLVWRRRENDPRRAQKIVLFVGAAVGLGFSFWNLLEWQARASDTTAHFSEVLWRLALVASLFVLYSLWARALAWLFGRNRRARATMQSPRGWWLTGLRVVLGFALFAPYLFTALNSHRYKLGNAITPQSAHKLAFQDVAFSSAGGVPLSGWLIPARSNGKAVIVCHGLGANKGIFLGVAPFLHRAGFTVLMFDFRGHGDSGGHTLTFGYDEARDVAAAVGFLQSRGFNSIALYGFSMGGAAVLNAAAQLPVKAVVVDSTFADFAPLVAQNLPRKPPLLNKAALAITDFFGWLEIGVTTHGISPRPRIAAISPRPILIIHGLDDSLIPFKQSQTIARLAPGPKELWLVPGAQHCLCRLVDIKTYETRVAAFLQRSVR